MGPELRNQKSIARRVLRSKHPLFLEYKSVAENKTLTLMMNAKKKFRSLGMLLKKEGEEELTPAGWHKRIERSIMLVLGLLWIVDGVLQLQPSMFAQTFADAVLAVD